MVSRGGWARQLTHGPLSLPGHTGVGGVWRMITRVPPGTWETLSFPSSKAAGDTAYQLPIDPRLRVRGRGGRTTDATMVSPSEETSARRNGRPLRFTGVVAGAVLRLVRNLVAWRRSLDIPGWFSMQSIERQTLSGQTTGSPPSRRRTATVSGDVLDRRQLADKTIGVSLPYFPSRTRSALQSTE